MIKTNTQPAIVFISAALVPGIEANAVNVMKLSSGLSRYGHPVKLFAVPGFRDIDPYEYYDVSADFEIQRFGSLQPRVVGPFRYAFEAARRIRKLADVDVIYSRYPYPLLLLRLMGERRPMIYHIHDLPTRNIVDKTLRLLLRTRGLEGLVVVSDSLKELLKRKYRDYDLPPVHVCRNGADPVASQKMLAKEAMPTKHDGTRKSVLGYVGSLLPGRGIDIVQGIARRVSDVEIEVVGGNASQVDEWRVASTENIRFHGHVPHSELARLFRRFDVLLAPYQRTVPTIDWASPIKIFEYMSYGIPMVVSDFPVVREILVDSVHALIVPPDDVTAWVRAIELLRLDSSLYTSIAANARTEFENRHTWLHRAQDLSAFIGGIWRRSVNSTNRD